MVSVGAGDLGAGLVVDDYLRAGDRQVNRRGGAGHRQHPGLGVDRHPGQRYVLGVRLVFLLGRFQQGQPQILLASAGLQRRRRPLSPPAADISVHPAPSLVLTGLTGASISP